MDGAGVLKDIVQGVHLFVAKIGFNGVLIKLIAFLLLVLNGGGDVLNVKQNGFAEVWSLYSGEVELEVLDATPINHFDAVTRFVVHNEACLVITNRSFHLWQVQVVNGIGA